MAEQFFVREFDTGLTLVAQRMKQASSAALTMLLPMGASRDPADGAGTAAAAAHWLTRGAGQRDSRQLNDALDRLGCHHNEDARGAHMILSAALLGRGLPEALSIYADIVRRPRLADETFASCRDLVGQALDALEDEPMRLCNVLVREKFYPQPLGANPLGTRQSVASLKTAGVRRHVGDCFTPRGAILSVAGEFEWDELAEAVEGAFGDWRGEDPPAVSVRPAVGGVTHIAKPTAQMQITIAYPAATPGDGRYYPARVAEMVLSGGMGARLFTEVREKRGLVYAVVARYHCLKDHAGMFVYAGTTPERAQETLEVAVAELRRLAEGIEGDEVERARTQLKSALIMQGESTSARSDALAADYYYLGRLRSLEEISAAVDAVGPSDVLGYVKAFPARELTVLTIGPKEPDTTGAI